MSHHKIDPLKKVTLSDMVAEKLRELIVQGAYKEGEQLNELELASRFNVSRGPVREGLRQLVHAGLLRSEPHRGAFVAELTEEDFADIHRAREVVEAAAINDIIDDGRHAAVAAALLKLTQSMQRAFAAREWSRLADLISRFHTELVRGSGSHRLARMYSSLIDEARICLRLTMGEPDASLVEAHVKIAELLASGDRQGTLDALVGFRREPITSAGHASAGGRGSA